MTELDEKTSRTLLVVARTLFPYDHLDDTYYSVVLDAIRSSYRGDGLAVFKRGADQLDSSAGSPFAEQTEDVRVSLLKAVEGTSFFKKMHGVTVRELFNNPAIWPHFGYEGPSARKGGFLKRGFDQKFWQSDD